MSGFQISTHTSPDFNLESGEVVSDLMQAYTLQGRLNKERDNLVIIFHSLTGDPSVDRWWPGLVGDGLAIDTGKYAVLTPNLLGSCYGTSKTWDDTGARKSITTRDIAKAVFRIIQSLDVKSVALVTGGSLGGMAALEWTTTFPELTRNTVVFAAPAAHTAYAIGWNHVQRTAVELSGSSGLEIARMAAMMVYRTPQEFESRFGRERRSDGVFQIQSYLTYQGKKLLDRFDLSSYLTLLDAMDSHDIGRYRGGLTNALSSVKGRLIGVGIPGDLLYLPEDVIRWVDIAKSAGVDASYTTIDSSHGHDAFLLEHSQVKGVIMDVLK